MQIQIDNASGRPVYQQIIDQVKRDIALGRLVKEEKLSTVRELAVHLAINPNTIAKAYRQLEQEGIIVTRPGAGAFVANLDSNLSRAVKKKIVCDELERIAVEAFHMQIDSQTLAEWFRNAVDKFNLHERKPSSEVPKGGQSNE
ncbi:MAG: GntR family transcriptional regulator [Planctomycetota bacterium]